MTRNQEPGGIAGRFHFVMRSLLRSPARLGALYLLVELAAVVLLIWAFGWGWAILVLIGTFLAGVLLAGTQLKGQLRALRRAGNVSGGAVTDGVLVGLGAFLVVLPGVVTHHRRCPAAGAADAGGDAAAGRKRAHPRD